MSDKQEESLKQEEVSAEGEKGPSKSALKKLEKEKKKAEQKAARQAKNQEVSKATTGSEEDVSAGKYGLHPLIQSTERTNKHYDSVDELNESKANQTVFLRVRVHANRSKGNLCFLVLRHRFSSVQAVLAKSKEVSKQMVNFVAGITKESIVDVEGTVVVVKDKIESTTQQDVELQINKIFVISPSVSNLPLQLEDASRPSSVFKQQDAEIKKIETEISSLQSQVAGKEDTEEGKKLLAEIEKLSKAKGEATKYVKVNRETRLNHRIIDLRTLANQAIFRLQGAVCHLFREFLVQNSFTEIHSPKLMGCASEGGASVFKVNYFNTFAYLAQSPQFHKQMAICADMDRVFEIGPVFRAELSFTHRHLTEFVGLDLEMAFKEHYYEVLDIIEGVFTFMFNGIETRYARELDIIRAQFPFEPLKYNKTKTLRLKYVEGIKMLQEAGEKIGETDDISTPQEKLLGKLVRAKYDTDFYVLDKFPTAVRPFYTMPDPQDPTFSNSYDFFIRGEEIMSGAQRVHDSAMLEQRAKDCGVPLDGIKDYLDAFKYGAPPHAGGGVGMERVVMLYLGLKNIRQTSMFPRDPQRLNP